MAAPADELRDVLRGATDEQLTTVLTMVAVELDARRVVATAAADVARIAAVVYQSAGGDGRPWRQPLGGHDAYPDGAIVTFDGRRWRSTRPSNVWRPGDTDAGWAEVETAEPPEPADPAGPVPAWRAGETVTVGDRRSYAGVTYVAVQAHTTQLGWEPPQVPALWTT